MKAVFYTDTQLSGQTPKNRIDNYQESLLSKIEEVYGTALKTGADCVICGGDFFNSHRIFSYELLSNVMNLICEFPVDTYMTVGQHDLIGYNPASFKSSALGFVAGQCQRLHILWEPVTVKDVVISASHVWENLKDAGKGFQKDKGNILVAHHLLTNKKTLFDSINTTDFSNWMKEKGVRYDLVLSGDLHDGYDLHETNGTWFCNPGSLARQAISDLHRPPRMAIIELEPGGLPHVQVVNIQCAKAGSVVFGEDLIGLIRDEEFNANRFVDGVQSFESEAIDIYDLIRKIASAKGINQEIVNYIMSKKETIV